LKMGMIGRMQSRSLFAILTVVWLRLKFSNGQVNVISDEACREADAKLYEGFTQPEFIRMIKKYNETCTSERCQVVPEEPLDVFLTWDYGGVNFALRTTCESRRNHKACTVKTSLYHKIKVDGIAIRVWVIEEDKAVCFPPTCSDDQINILEPNPGQCNNAADCEIISYEVNCPDRVISDDTGTCEQDKLPLSSAFHVARGVTELAILADCTSIAAGTGSLGLCEASTGSVDASFRTDFTDFETDRSFLAHEFMCEQDGGEICLFDGEAKYMVSGAAVQSAADDIVKLAGAEDVILRNKFVKLPRCMAIPCQEADMAEVLAYHASRYALQGFDLLCDLNSDNCEINLSKIQCKSSTQPYTNFPIKVTTASPIKVNTNFPTKSPTDFPTISLNTLPLKTSSPSVSRSAEPSVSPPKSLSALPDESENIAASSSDDVSSSTIQTWHYAKSLLVIDMAAFLCVILML